MSYRQDLGDLVSLREAMNRLFEESFVHPTRTRGQQVQQPQAQSVPVNVFQDGDNVTFVAPMPGLEAENVEITVNEGVLTLRGEKRGPGEERRDFLLREWSIGPYHRALQLPEALDVNSARASFNNGVLVVTFNKSERERTHRIEVQAGS